MGYCGTLAFRSYEVRDDLGHSKQPDRQGHEIDAVCELREAEGKAPVSCVDVHSHRTKEKTQEDHANGFDDGAMRKNNGGKQSEQHQREVFGCSKGLRDERQRWSEQGDEKRGHTSCKERSQCSNGERSAGAAASRHLVPIEAGDNGRALSGQVDQDRGCRSAVLRSIEDAGEHDEAGDRLKVERQRQQHRDRGDGCNARQHPHQSPPEAAEKAEQKIGGCKSNGETKADVREKIRHQSLGNTGMVRPRPHEKMAMVPRQRTAMMAMTSTRRRLCPARLPIAISNGTATISPSFSTDSAKAIMLIRTAKMGRHIRGVTSVLVERRNDLLAVMTPMPIRIQQIRRGTYPSPILTAVPTSKSRDMMRPNTPTAAKNNPE